MLDTGGVVSCWTREGGVMLDTGRVCHVVRRCASGGTMDIVIVVVKAVVMVPTAAAAAVSWLGISV